MKVLQFPSAYQSGQTPYDIFKDRMTAIGSITDGIKNIIANKFINNQLKLIADNIQNAVDEQKVNELVNLILEKPSDEIYPVDLENTVSQFVDNFANMGPMMKKEIMMGNLPSPKPEMGPMMQKETMMGNLPNLNQGMPQATTGLPAIGGAAPTPSPTTETMIPKTDIYQLYNTIKSMPSGQVNWANLLKTMTEKKPWFMGGPTGPEQYVLNQISGQVTDPKSKMISDINLAKLVQQTFYPEEVVKEPTEWEKKTELFLQTNPTVEELKQYLGGRIALEKMSDFDKKWSLLMQRDHTVEEEMKLIGVYTEPKIDIKDILENIPEGFEISSLNVSTSGTTSFSFKPIDTTNPWEFDTWDEAQEFLRTHPQEGFIGKIETEKGGFNVTFYQKGTTTDELKPITGSDIKTFGTMLYGDEESPGVVTPEDYAKVKDYIERSEKNFPIPEYLEIAEMNVSKCLNTDNSVLDIELYRYFYQYYKAALKGKAPKYLPPKAIPKIGFFKNKYGSALADDYELDFKAMDKDNVTEEELMKKLQEIEERH